MNKTTGPIWAAIALALVFSIGSRVLATPVEIDRTPASQRDSTQAASGAMQAQPDAPRRSADLGLSTAIPLNQAAGALATSGQSAGELQQPPLIEPGTLILVGLGLIIFGVTRRLRGRSRKSR